MWTNPALWTAIAGVIAALAGLVAAFRINQKVNAQASQTPVGGSKSASDPPAGPQSLLNRYLNPWNRRPFRTRMVPVRHHPKNARGRGKMVISLAQGYEKAILVVAQILKSRTSAINLVTDSITRPMIPCASDIIAITYFPAGNTSQYGNGVYSIATLWDIDLIHDDPMSII